MLLLEVTFIVGFIKIVTSVVVCSNLNTVFNGCCIRRIFTLDLNQRSGMDNMKM